MVARNYRVLTLNDPPLPVVTLSLSTDSLCTTDPPLLLDGNTPTGGSFSGMGVSGNSFDPSIGAGDYPVPYSYTDANNCTANANDTMHVEFVPVSVPLPSRKYSFASCLIRTVACSALQ